MNDTRPVLERLMEVIDDRKRNPPAKSYTTSLFQGGVDRIGCKVMEEASEVVRAARKAADSPEAQAHLVYEAADLLYHLLVLLSFRDVSVAAVEQELGRRFGISGIDEKASRSQ